MLWGKGKRDEREKGQGYGNYGKGIQVWNRRGKVTGRVRV